MQAVLIQAVVMFLVLAATTAVIALVRRLFTPTTGCCTCPPPPATETATITYAHSRRLWYSAATCRRGGCTRLTWWSLGESPASMTFWSVDSVTRTSYRTTPRYRSVCVAVMRFASAGLGWLSWLWSARW